MGERKAVISEKGGERGAVGWGTSAPWLKGRNLLPVKRMDFLFFPRRIRVPSSL